jgi:hypothetical protein
MQARLADLDNGIAESYLAGFLSAIGNKHPDFEKLISGMDGKMSRPAFLDTHVETLAHTPQRQVPFWVVQPILEKEISALEKLYQPQVSLKPDRWLTATDGVRPQIKTAAGLEQKDREFLTKLLNGLDSNDRTALVNRSALMNLILTDFVLDYSSRWDSVGAVDFDKLRKRLNELRGFTLFIDELLRRTLCLCCLAWIRTMTK